MSAYTIILIMAGYFGLLLLISHFTSRSSDNNAFFRGERKSPWWLVAFGMIGTSISGVSVVSVPSCPVTSSWPMCCCPSTTSSG